MTSTTEFQSFYSLLRTQTPKGCSVTTLERDENSKSFNQKAANLCANCVPSNTNAKDAATNDKLKTIFRERHGHKTLSEQKVNGWLLRNQSYYDSIPKDLIEIPEEIWAPPETNHSTYLTESDPQQNDDQNNQTGNNTLTKENYISDETSCNAQGKLWRKSCSRSPSDYQSTDTICMVPIFKNIKFKPENSNAIRSVERRSTNNSRLSTNVVVDGRCIRRNRSICNQKSVQFYDTQVPYFFHPPKRRYSSAHENTQKRRNPLRVTYNQC